jgi:hypothetical protein
MTIVIGMGAVVLGKVIHSIKDSIDMSTVLVKFYRLNSEGTAVICRTELCSSVFEADILAAAEMSRGIYSNISIEESTK